jgi:hypothetical protein
MFERPREGILIQGNTTIERKRSIGCPLPFVRRSLLRNKKRVYISTTGETQKKPYVPVKQLTTDSWPLTSNRALARLG